MCLILSYQFTPQLGLPYMQCLLYLNDSMVCLSFDSSFGFSHKHPFCPTHFKLGLLVTGHHVPWGPFFFFFFSI